MTARAVTVEYGVPGTGVAADPAVRAAIDAAAPGDFPELIDLADGGLAAVRVDAIEASQVPPFAEVRGAVEGVWRANARRDALLDRAEALADRIRQGEMFAAVGLSPRTVSDVARQDDAVAPALLDAALSADAGETVVVMNDDGRAHVLRVDAVRDADPEAPETVALVEAIRAQARNEVADDLLASYATAVRDEVGFTINESAVQAVQTQLLGP